MHDMGIDRSYKLGANNTIQTADYENDIKLFHLLCNNFNL